MDPGSEHPQAGLTLIVVTVADTVCEWTLWLRAGGIIMMILVLSRVILLVYGITLARHRTKENSALDG